MFRLDGKVAIVTGASRGIGAAIAKGFADAGASLLLVSRTQPGLAAAWHAADLSTTAPIPAIVKAALDRFGRIDILVNNAGTIRRGPVVDQSEADWDAVLDTNLKTPFFLAQACARQMVAQGSGGKIIHMSSIAAQTGTLQCSSYVASKHALLGLTRAMANELAPHRINVNALGPGYTRTDFIDVIDEAREREIVKRIPQGRFGTPEDVVGAAVFLASPASDYMHGQIVYVDGGFLHR